MHGLEEFAGPKTIDLSNKPWYSEMTRYHWFVLIVAALGWLFDCLDQQLFTLARPTAMRDLLGVPEGHRAIGFYGGIATTVFMLGWASGGLFFGALGDRIGRARTMLLTILLYSACTGLSALSVTVYDFMFYRFITGLGVGGEFAVGVALVAEVMPDRARPRALSLLQALSAIGNVSAAVIGIGLAPLEHRGISAWRVMFVIGALPALLALLIRRRLKEPERFVHAVQEGKKKQAGSYAALFGDPRWRRSALVGLFLAIPGVIGLWGIGFFAADLSRVVFRAGITPQVYEEMIAESTGDTERLQALEQLLKWEKDKTPLDERPALDDAGKEIKSEADGRISGKLSIWQALTLLMTQCGAFAGMYSFGWAAQRIGRKPVFFVAYLMAMLSTAFVFWNLKQPSDIFWMMPLMGFFQLSLFAGYAIYFPEIFPTHLRSTGTSFCYNVGRYVSAFGPYVFGLLTSYVFTGPNYPAPVNWQYAGVTMSSVFIIGMITLLFARETKDQPLPE
jgi:MFS family permease